MKKRKNKDENVEEVLEEKDVESTTETKVDSTIKPKKTIFYIFYEILGVICLVLLVLTFFDKPKEFISNKADLILGIVILCYAILFLLPYAFKKKESKFINFLTIIELAIIVIISIFLLKSKDSKFLNLSRSTGLVIYVFGLIEIIRGYHSNGGIKVFKNPLFNGLIKYFNIFLITLGTYVFFIEPFDKYLIESIRIALGFLAIIAVIIGLIKMPKKK